MSEREIERDEKEKEIVGKLIDKKFMGQSSSESKKLAMNK